MPISRQLEPIRRLLLNALAPFAVAPVSPSFDDQDRFSFRSDVHIVVFHAADERAKLVSRGGGTAKSARRWRILWQPERERESDTPGDSLPEPSVLLSDRAIDSVGRRMVGTLKVNLR